MSREHHPRSRVELIRSVDHLHAEVEQLRQENEQLLEAHRELEGQRALYADVYDSSPIACLALAGDGLIRTLNQTAAGLLGVSKERALGAPLRSFTAEPARRQLAEHLSRCRHQEGPVLTEIAIARRDGPAIPAALWSTALPEQALYPSALIDITERLRADDARHSLENAERSARAQSEAKDQFIATLSHELRTPLTPVLVAVSALVRRDEVPGWLRQMAEMIRRNVCAEARLIDDLLDAARLRRGKLRVQSEPMDLHEAVAQALEVQSEGLTRKQLGLETDLDAARHHVNGDPLRLRQVFWNLIGNAIKFTPPGGRLSVRSWNRDGVIAVEVSDTGIGVAPELLEHLFQPFEQGPDEARGAGGLGLGLAIARGVTELHGGRLLASSAGPGTGTRFIVELGTTEPPAPRAAAASPPAAPPDRCRRILLVEDHPDTAASLAELLEEEGFEVKTAGTAAAALAVDLEDVDLVVSDLGLPDRSGHELMRELQGRRPLPAIALSGYGTEADLRASRDAGFAAHLTKPVEWAELLAAIERVGRPPPH
jgi:PAS domain S-box-containing protein